MRKIVLVLPLLAGCAHPVVAPCPEPCSGEGLRFYRPAMYLEVAPDGSWKTLALPDPSQQYVLRVEGWLGDASLTPTLADGWNFVSMSASTNNDATIAALAGAAGTAKGLMGASLDPRTAAPLAPGLYRIDLTQHNLVGPMRLIPSPGDR